MAVTKAQKEATARYEAKAYDKILLRLKQGKKEEIEVQAKAAGESINGYISAAIEARLSGPTAPAPTENVVPVRAEDVERMNAHLELHELGRDKFIHRAIQNQIRNDLRAKMLGVPVDREEQNSV